MSHCQELEEGHAPRFVYWGFGDQGNRGLMFESFGSSKELYPG